MTESIETSPTQPVNRANVELIVAFEATVDAFARAMELREGEPLGHTHQVTEVTINLARAVGIDNARLSHIRRGALLHDIGKLAIPESILKKAGALTYEERAIIQQHPQFAYDLLSPIVFLHETIEIPYFHHEWWNGEGYPQRLRGEQIPLSARVFAVVDVWDALTSDRPQRKAWSQSQALEYLQENAGKQFDPAVVKVFLTDKIRKKVTKPLV
jgi:putative nucleotidyltransferase with HDIG domain